MWGGKEALLQELALCISATKTLSHEKKMALLRKTVILGDDFTSFCHTDRGL